MSSKPTSVFHEIVKSIGILMGLLGFLTFLGITAIFLLKDRDTPQKNIIEVPSVEGKPAEKMRVQAATISPTDASDILALFRESEGAEGENVSSYSYKGFKPPVNYLFIDSISGESAWLFNHTKYIIPAIAPVAVCKACVPLQKDKIIYIASVVTADTNGNSRLDREDDAALYLLKSNGTQLTELQNKDNHPFKVSSLLSTKLIDPDTISVIYQSNSKIYRHTVSTKTFTTKTIQEIKNWDGKSMEAPATAPANTQ